MVLAVKVVPLRRDCPIHNLHTHHGQGSWTVLRVVDKEALLHREEVVIRVPMHGQKVPLEAALLDSRVAVDISLGNMRRAEEDLLARLPCVVLSIDQDPLLTCWSWQ